MWRLGHHDRGFNPTMSLLVRLGGPVSLGAVQERVGALCAVVPRLRERVVPPALPMVPPRWEPDPCFSVENHVSLHRGLLWAVADAVVTSPWTEGRPPWRVVVTSLDPGEMVLHLHHSYTDGLGGVRLITSLFDFHGVDTAAPAPPSPTSSDPGGGGLFDDVVGELERGFGLLAQALPWARRTLGAAATRPAAVLDPAAELMSALEGQWSGATGPASPLLAERSADVHLVPLELSLDAMRATSRRLGVTVNDVFVTGLLDGLARYHAKYTRLAPSLRLALPISHRQTPDGMHNQLSGAVVRGPLGPLDLDFAERARLVHEIILLARRQPWAAAVEHLAAAAARLPGAVTALAAGLRSIDVIASNVAGPPQPMWFAGVPVASMTPIGPRSGAAVNATLMSYCDVAAIGLNLDPAAVTSPAVLQDCLASAFRESLGS